MDETLEMEEVVAPPTLGEIVEELFNSLLDLPVAATELSSAPAWEQGFMAVYGKNSESVAGVCRCDLAFGNSSAAAIARIPAAVASEETSDGTCPDNLRANLCEIFNVCTSVLRKDKSVRLAMQRIFSAQGKIPQQLQELLDRGKWEHFKIDIEGYESGTFSICAF